MKKLILNADDFCLSPVFNEVILGLVAEGCVSSTSVMIDRYNESQRGQVDRLIETGIGAGLHVEFASADDFEGEIKRQVDLFKKVFGRRPAQIDLHKSDYLKAGYPVIMESAEKLDLPFRHHGFDTENLNTTSKESIGAIHNSLDKIIIWLKSFEDGDSGELVLHPGEYDSNCATSLNYERVVDVTKAKEVKRYCDGNNIEIIDFSNLGK